MSLRQDPAALEGKLRHLHQQLQSWELALCCGNDLHSRLMLHFFPQIDHQASSAAALLARPLASQKPLLLVASDDLDDGPVLQLLERLSQLDRERECKVVLVLEDQCELIQLQNVLAAGVQGMCRQGAIGHGLLVLAMQTVIGGGTYIDSTFAGRLAQDRRHRSLTGRPEWLDEQERRILALTAQGYNSAEIASRLGIRSDTTRRYLSRIYQKIGVRDRAQAVGWCISHGLVTRQELERVYRPALQRSSGA
jgi:DNA-binding NarL/FixJ family response regulator